MTSLLRLADRPWKISYGATDDRLHDFYLPALERSIRFDRMTGFFSSSALAIAAAGIVRLIHNGGRMRLLCGAQLSREDVDAIKRGDGLEAVAGRAMVGSLADPSDLSMRARLEALAWLVAEDRLDIMVVLPRGPDGYPLPASEAREYYHPKEGVFEDADGNRLAFSGSSNDSENGWQWNYEVFQVYTTWPREEAPALQQFVAEVEGRFRRLWTGREPDWVAIDIPTAARERLLAFRPSAPPASDPLERQPPPRPARPTPTVDLRERLRFQFLRDAPYLPGADRLGIETSIVTPWPHQAKVALRTVATFPHSYLFCDEVGLGKTIEVGAVLRQLILTGQVRRALLLVPKSVLTQWQEELYEKFALNAVRYDGSELRDALDQTLRSTGNPWAAAPLLLASSQLAKRRDRQEQVLDAGPWDVVVVDEAHHARRKRELDGRYRPNRLLELVAGTGDRPGLKDRTSALYLLTATPMQTEPVEVWDLLRPVGLGGRWASGAGQFVRYFEELRRPASEADWDFLLDMLADELDAGGGIDPAFAEAARRQLGPVDWEVLQRLPGSAKRATTIATLRRLAIGTLRELLRRHTPLRRFMWRHTRTLLRGYYERGLLAERVPDRQPRNEWIELDAASGGERELYDRIDEYVSDFYRRYEAERHGLGFVMTVYRRRLTSSFFAIQRSLERRLAFLRGEAVETGGLTEEDLEEDDLGADVAEQIGEDNRSLFRAEIEYVEDFLHRLKMLATDSKLEQLLADLQEIFHSRETVVVFTQYADTMDHLRDQLRPVYGSQVACYSGRGGEVWDGVAWVRRPKEVVKEAFRTGEQVKILVCTDAASEGLNLQTCGALINYDMPWNPMRVEQRIGRIDRIGQRYDTVWIRNYFYEDTVEADIYRRLADRIGWFEEVVGRLQPILHDVRQAIGSLAMTPTARRRQLLEDAVADLRRKLDEQEDVAFDLDAAIVAEPQGVSGPPPPVTLVDLERALVRSQALGGRFAPHPEIPGAHLLSWGGRTLDVTFEPRLFDRYPQTLQLLTYGNRLLDELLGTVEPATPGLAEAGLLHLRSSDAVGPATRLYAIPDGPVASYAQLSSLVEHQAPAWIEEQVASARAFLLRAVEEERRRRLGVAEERWRGERLALREEARLVLVRAALVELARSQAPSLFGEAPQYGFGSEVVHDLRRHGMPFRGLWRIVGEEELEARPTDSYFLEVQGARLDLLERRFEGLRQQGIAVLQRWSKLPPTPSLDESLPSGVAELTWFRLGGEPPAAADEQ